MTPSAYSPLSLCLTHWLESQAREATRYPTLALDSDPVPVLSFVRGLLMAPGRASVRRTSFPTTTASLLISLLLEVLETFAPVSQSGNATLPVPQALRGCQSGLEGPW